MVSAADLDDLAEATQVPARHGTPACVVRCNASVPHVTREGMSNAGPELLWWCSRTGSPSRRGWSRRPPGAAGKVRPEVLIDDRVTRVLVEQTAAVDPNRLGQAAGSLTFSELRQVEAALRLVLKL